MIDTITNNVRPDSDLYSLSFLLEDGPVRIETYRRQIWSCKSTESLICITLMVSSFSWNLRYIVRKLKKLLKVFLACSMFWHVHVLQGYGAISIRQQVLLLELIILFFHVVLNFLYAFLFMVFVNAKVVINKLFSTVVIIFGKRKLTSGVLEVDKNLTAHKPCKVRTIEGFF